MRYFIHLNYMGKAYAGWQWQLSTSKTIQQEVTIKFRELLKDETLSINGCGRTDAGVHASQYFAHLDSPREINSEDIIRINKRLPPDIVVLEAIKVDEKSNARFDAISRTYDFFIHTKDDPYLNPISLLFNKSNLDLFKMVDCLSFIEANTDFAKLCRSPDKHRSTKCEIQQVQLFWNHDKSRIQFQITANRFLKGMIRILIQTLLDVGSGKVSKAEFINLLNLQTERKHKHTAPPQGLYLSKICYPYLDRDNLSQGFDLLRLDK